MQTSYSIDQAAGRVGGIVDSSLVRDIESRINTAAEVKLGCVVTRGASVDEIVHPNTAAKVTDEKLVRGVVVAAHESESKNDSAAGGYVAKSVVPVMRKGRVWVLAEDTITEGTSTVNVRVEASGGDTQLGALRGASQTTFSAVLPKSKWKSSTTGTGQLAVLELDL